MKFKSLILSEARGSMGGATFSRNGNAAYARAKAIPVNPRSASQLINRAVLTAITSNWRLLSSPQREAWKALALTVPYQNSVGDTAYYSGFQLYMKLNLVFFQQNGAPLNNAPASAPTFPAYIIGAGTAEQDAITFSDFSLNVGTALVGDATGMYAEFQATSALSNGKDFIPDNLYRQIFLQTPPVSGSVILTYSYEARYGTPASSLIGSAIFVRVRLVETASGFTSPWVVRKLVVAEA